MNTNPNSRARKISACALTVALTTGASVGIAASATAAPAAVVTATATALPTSTVVSPDGIAEVRSGPGVTYPSVARLENGNRVTVLETRSGWSRVGINQWVASWLLCPGDAKPSTTIWRVQVGATQDKAKADAIAKTARTKGFQTFVRRVGGWYRVQIGAFAVRANADDMVTRARAAGFSDAFVRTD